MKLAQLIQRVSDKNNFTTLPDYLEDDTMIATTVQLEAATLATLPALAVPDAERAISVANRWLHNEVAMLIHVSRATFDPVTFCWHLPVQLSYPHTGPLGVIGDIYLQAATGQMIGAPKPDELRQRAVVLAEAHGFRAEDDDDDDDDDDEDDGV